ncbi:MAG: hypothetical protein E7069_09130 [Bacteroidales bacterium]|jgi:hypothetical protein|nr:hypothetical protein [Bacteroidales bacterium]
MKKFSYISLAALLFTAIFTACEEEEGTAPGNDSEPIVTLYSFDPSEYKKTDNEYYNADNDLMVRVAANNKASEIYYLAELTSSVDAYTSANGASAYYDKVISEGNKVDVAPAETGDVFITDMRGQNTITFVAVNGSKKNASVLSFFGYTWNTLSKGTYTYSVKASTGVFGLKNDSVNTNIKKVETELQVSADDPQAYRFKDLWGNGKHMYINKTEYTDEDEDGAYTFVRIPSQTTPYEKGESGAIGVRDIATWQGDDFYVTSPSLGSVLYDDGSFAYIVVQYFCSNVLSTYGADKYVATE